MNDVSRDFVNCFYKFETLSREPMIGPSGCSRPDPPMPHTENSVACGRQESCPKSAFRSRGPLLERLLTSNTDLSREIRPTPLWP